MASTNLYPAFRRAVVEALQRFAIVELIYTISDWLLPRPAIWKRWWRQGAGPVIFYLSNLANCRTRKNHDPFRTRPKSFSRQSILPIHPPPHPLLTHPAALNTS